jgi:hypothetical protein
MLRRARTALYQKAWTAVIQPSDPFKIRPFVAEFTVSRTGGVSFSALDTFDVVIEFEISNAIVVDGIVSKEYAFELLTKMNVWINFLKHHVNMQHAEPVGRR